MGKGRTDSTAVGKEAVRELAGSMAVVGLAKVPAASISAGPTIDVDLHADVSVPWSCPAPFDSNLAPTNNSWSISLLQVVWEGQ